MMAGRTGEQSRHARNLLRRRRRPRRRVEHLDGKVGVLREDVERHAEIRRARATRAIFAEHPPQEIARLRRRGRGAAEIQHRRHDTVLVLGLVQHAPASAERRVRRRARDHDQG
jgi:hypothetical protein